MVLKMLDWDSDFFEKKIYSLQLHKDDNLNDVLLQLQIENADLVYVYLPVDSPLKAEIDNRSDIVLYDHKLTYSISLFGKSFESMDGTEETTEDPDEKFISLAISSGIHSRFALDPLLSDKFEKMYELWLRNSINKKIADKVFVTKANDFIVSFVTSKIKQGVGNIGLIATDKEFRGQSLGRRLIDQVHHWYQLNNIEISEVVTQKANKVACSFYENYGFKIAREELVYHWQIKK